MTKDTTPPAVTIVSAVPATSGGVRHEHNDHMARERERKLLGARRRTDCSTGTVQDSGTYSTAPANATSTVQASSLAEGTNTIRVCVTDAGANTGSTTTTVTKDTTHSQTVLFRSASSAQNGVASSLVLPVPAGVAAGDVLLAVVDIASTQSATAPSGWTLIRTRYDDRLGRGDRSVR